MGRAVLLERGARREIADTRIGLDVLAGIVVERLAGLLVDALGPVDLRIGLRQDRLTVEAVEGVEEAVAGRVGDELARLPGDVAVDQDVGADLVVVPHVTGRELEIPVHVAGVGIVGDGAVGVEIVARPIGRVEHRHRIAGAPDRLVGGGIVGAGHPDGAAAGLPRIGVALPGLAAGLAGRRNGEFAPHQLAGGGIETSNPVAHALVAIGGAAVKATSGVSENEVSHTTLPLSLSVAMMRGELQKPPAPVMTRLPHNAAPRLRIWRSCLGSMRHTMRPTSPERTSIL